MDRYELAAAIRESYAGMTKGERVPSMEDLSEEFGPDRKTVAKALALLEDDYFIVKIPGKSRRFTGMVMHDNDVANAGIEHVLAFRLAIEPGAAMLAARECGNRKNDPRFITKLTRSHNKLQGLSDEGPVAAWLKADQEFHAEFHALVGNPLLAGILHRTSVRVRANVEQVVTELFDDLVYRKETKGQHKRMYQAIVAGDEWQALQETYKHLNYAHGKILTQLGRGWIP